MPSLLVLTSSYPYGLGEAFFEIELQRLAKRFERIDILPSTTRSTSSRSLPEGVRTLKPLLTSKRKDIFNALFSPTPCFLVARDLWPLGVSLRDLANSVRLRAGISARLRGLKQEKYDLIYTYWGFPWSVMAPQLCSIAPCVQRLHAADFWGESGGRRLRKGAMTYSRYFERLFFVSKAGKALASEALPEDIQGRSKVRYLGSEDIGPIVGIPYSEGFSIISCAFVIERKRLDRIARIVRILSRSRPVSWTHIGVGNNRAIEKLKELAGNDATVSFTGHVHHSEVPEVFRLARPNILMSMSDSEGLAINVLEAMSANIPIVSTNVGGMAEAVTKEVGLLIDRANFDDYERLAAMILKESHPGGILAKAKPRQVWEEKFDAESNADEFADELLRICHAGR